MFQTFEVSTSPEQGPGRLALVRAAMADAGLDAFLVPRADAHQGEYVAPRDARLAWLTGFTGSAGFCAVLADEAGVFIDGRYRVQVRSQVADVFTPVNWPTTTLGPWLAQRLPEGAQVGFDPWLHTAGEIETLRAAAPGLAFLPTDNLVDAVWQDQPAPPSGPAEAWPEALAGRSATEKCGDMADELRAAGQRACVLTLPDSICWLLNIRGSDIERNPVVHAFAILHDDGRVDLFCDPAKLNALARHLGDGVAVHPAGGLDDALAALTGPVRVDKATAPFAVPARLEGAGVELCFDADPCILAKARKSDAEIAGTRAAHLRDGAAMCRFLAWLDTAADRVTAGETVTEIDVVRALEGFRRDINQLRDISFETIAGSGPNGAIVHYRVNEDSNRALAPDELLLVDSGGQYLDGTTDITRTLAIGDPTEEQRACFTRVLQGMIALSRARWPRSLAGRDLDPLARYPLWLAGLDYDHGTGHGVGAYLSVHEGPQRISRLGEVPLSPGMILSNEPGYYRDGAFGIRIENLVVVQQAPALAGSDGRDQLSFETLTFAPIDRRLIDTALLAPGERDWLNAYHAEVSARITPEVDAEVAAWLARATAPI
ncbi:aminopeptidase P family protein [Oceaniglobus trochenteri]|uniref:aminopeptidase P family protein n=1 Tax=Oceaniglobus trochenteri TaxID=2763260 RepID=UPI001CFF920B|nr:aminopeptidase P family protein [Oceaniglobus trochenteri]